MKNKKENLKKQTNKKMQNTISKAPKKKKKEILGSILCLSTSHGYRAFLQCGSYTQRHSIRYLAFAFPAGIICQKFHD